MTDLVDYLLMPANSMLRHLVELARTATDAEAAELVILGEAEFRLVAGEQTIGGEELWSVQPNLAGAVNETRSVTTDYTSLLSIPITGPSAESGWIAVASRGSGSLSDSALESLTRVASLIEERLDRTVERIRLDQLGAVLRANQDELRIARDQLAATNTDLEQFAYIAAHELVSPLRSVALYAEVLQRLVPEDADETSDQARQCADAIRSGVTGMSQQVSYLLDFSRAQTSASAVEAVDLTDVVNSALDTLAEPLDEADAIVTVGDLPVVTGREVPLQSVFANLIKNAVNYRHPDRRLELEIASTDTQDGTRVTLTDNGVGIDSADHARVFQLFERASSDTPGTGIGLALSRRIIEAYGGEIGVEVGSPVGTVFWLELPDAVPA